MNDASNPAEPKRRPRWVILALFVLTQVVAFVVLLEVGARIFDPLGISYYPETARLLDEMTFEEPIGYRLAPDFEGRFYGVDVRTNAVGMRDRPVPARKEPDEFRILLIGDSVWFSVGVAIEDSIPIQLERLANQDAPPGRRYRTLNMGVPSYNTEQERIQLETLGMSLQPDAAILFLSANDLEDKMWVYEKRSSRAADLAQRSYAASLAFFLARPWLRALSTDPAAIARVEGDPARDPRLDALSESLSRIQRLLRAADVPLLVVHLNNIGDALRARAREVGAREGFPVRELDFSVDPRWSEENAMDFVNSDVDSHANAPGCVTYALAIHAWMIEDRLLE